jgi:hypothetical protein
MSMLNNIIYYESLCEAGKSGKKISSRKSFRWNKMDKIPSEALNYIYDWGIYFPPPREMDLEDFKNSLEWFVNHGYGSAKAKKFADELLEDIVNNHSKGQVIKYRVRRNKFVLTLE